LKSGRFFLDTAYVQALLNIKDQYHVTAETLFVRVRNAREVWVTVAVLIEIGNALARSYRKEASTFIKSCYTTPNMRIISVDVDLFQRAIELYQSRMDKTWGMTDCISFIVMQDQNLTDALTTDEHFQQAGFRALLRE
jgi:predicted nucleic acid-binding protein